MLRWLMVLVLAFGCGGDDDTGSGGEGDPCASSSECDTGLVCVDSRCERRAAPDSGTTDAGGLDAAGCPAARSCGETCCEAGQTCGGGLCCLPSDLCGGACCGGDQSCVADRCVLDCGERASCGDGADALCCDTGDVCYLGDCTTPGAECERTTECEETEYCEPTLGRCLPRATGEACEYMPPVGEFTLGEEWAWTGDAEAFPGHDQIMMTPMVANLTDDDEDGDIDADDIPDVVFNTFAGNDYWGNGILRVVSGDDGSRVWPAPGSDPGYRTTPGSELAIADVDPGSPGPEILACAASNRGPPRTYGHLMIIAADGGLIRHFDTAPNDVPCGFGAPAVGDMDGDGTPEIAVMYVLAHADGTVVQRFRTGGGGTPYSALYDVDDDGDLELVAGDGVFEYDGTVLWERDGTDGRPALPGGYVAIADIDLDDAPEIVNIGNHMIWALDPTTGDAEWGPIDINPPELADVIAANGNPGGGGPPPIANFDDDPAPEIAFAGGFAYVIFEGDGSRKWWFETVDRSSRVTGSSIFDFEGDGVAEVLYNDERTFRVFRGPDGSIYHEQCNTSGTLREYPIVVDVDNDDHAEVVLMENNYAFGGLCLDGSPASTGLHVFGHPENEWVRTRRIWNQHTYHVTNVNEDGTIPMREDANWRADRLNNFRQNVQPDGLFDAPDLVLVDLQVSTRSCPTQLRVSVRVLNNGRASAPADVPVTFYEDGVRIGQVRTTRPLLPGESELLELDPPFDIPADERAGTFAFTATVNAADEDPLVGLNECRGENNDAGPVEGTCPIIE